MLRVVSALTALLVSTVALADDRWSSPYAGIAVLERRMPGPIQVRAVVADLCTPGLRVRATRPAERGRTVRSFARAVGATVAINGDFYDRGYAPVGLAVGDGTRWPDTFDSVHWGLASFGEGRAEIALPEDPNEPPEPWVHEAIGGVPQIVIDGFAEVRYASRFCRDRHPRTAIGVSADRRSLILVAIDGRSPRSVGMTCEELAELMIELGAEHAMNLDGGGSTALYVRGRGLINAPSDGSERPVANHLALIAGGHEGVDACPWRGSFPPGGLPACDGEVPIDGSPLVIDDASACFAPSGPSVYEEEDHHATTAVACPFPGANACSASDSSVRWLFHVPEPGNYRVEAFVPASAGAPLTERASYALTHVGGVHRVTRDQSAARGRWIELFADVTLDRQNNVALELSDNTGELDRRVIAFDAVRVTRLIDPPSPARMAGVWPALFGLLALAWIARRRPR